MEGCPEIQREDLLKFSKFEEFEKKYKEYLDKAVEFAKEHELKNEHEENVVSNSFYSLGKFADEQYQTICNYVKSTSYEEHTELMRQFEIEKDMAKRYDLKKMKIKNSPKSIFNNIMLDNLIFF